MDDKKSLFIEKIQRDFPIKHSRVLQHLYTKPPVTFRINYSQISEPLALQALRKEGFLIRTGPLENSFVVVSSKGKNLSESPLVSEGKIYIQSLSSMIPVNMLDPREGDKILDLCAAPGSKTSQIALKTKGAAEIVAVDNNKKRIFKLGSNLESQGIDGVRILHTTGVGLERRYRTFRDYFDKILVDAPCSNEGLICLSEPETLENWNPKLSKKLAKLQKKLVSSGINMLKPGGVLVYSTCTFSKKENEDIVVWVLKKFKNITMLEQKKVIPDGMFTGFFAVKFSKLG